MSRIHARFLALLVFILLAHGVSSADQSAADWATLSGPYLGQSSPGQLPELFAPGLVSTDGHESNSAFSPDGSEFYYTVWVPETGTRIMFTRQVDGRWNAPRRASFSTHPTDVDPAISPNGDTMWFSSRRPRPGEKVTTRDDFDLWFAGRAPDGGWGEPRWLEGEVNSGARQVYSTFTDNDVMYFQSVREGGFGKGDIWRAFGKGVTYHSPQNLGPAVNSVHYEGDVYVAPDESYLVIAIYGREDDLGGGDLYVSFRDPSGEWSEPRNMGSSVNSPQKDFCPMVSPDGRYLFFSSYRRGHGDLFWVDSKVIESLRP